MSVYEKLAPYYDLLYNRQEDIPFILELVRQHPGPILDAACGTGRMLLQLARRGHEVVGLDASPYMLDQLRSKLAREPEDVRKRVTLVEGDLRTFDLSRKFALALVLWSAFYELAGEGERTAALARLAAHLERGGALAMDNYVEHSPARPAWGSTVRDGKAHHRADYPSPTPDEPGRRIRCYEAATFDPTRSVSTKDIILQILSADDTIRGEERITATLYYASPAELKAEMQRAGFRNIDQHGWFDFSELYDPKTADFGRQITVATL
jgi:SAM-dependent methyltransferase